MIYLDYAAATPVDPKVTKKMLPFFKEKFANPSSIYQFAQKGRGSIENARAEIAKIIGCLSEEIYFTAGGTEANNWAIFGIANATQKKHIISTALEHHSVLHPLRELARRGYQVTYLNVDRFGKIKLEDLEKAITKDTFLITIMYGQNEIGTIENIEAIGKIARNAGVYFHADACQAAGQENINVRDLQVDLMTLNAGKVYGPKGVGCLYIKKNLKITPLIYGGGQEHRLRGGTENVAGIVGFAEALKIAENLRKKEKVRLTKLRDILINGIIKDISDSQLNGDPKQRLANNVNISFKNVSGESLLLRLDLEGICVSTGAACSAGTLEPSHVLLGIGLPKDLASGIRLTLGRHTTPKEIKTVLKKLPEIIKDLRK
jgi:cysteine desulfurase